MSDRPRCLLLPGWGTSPARLDVLRDALADGGLDARTFAYEPSADLDTLGRWLAAEIRGGADERVHLVGHSLGGLVCAAATLEDPSRVGTVTTINAPWRGTWVGWTGPSELAVELRWGSDTLERLRAELELHLQQPNGPTWILAGASLDLATPLTTSIRIGVDSPRLQTLAIPVAGHSVSLEKDRLVERVTDAILSATAPTGR